MQPWLLIDYDDTIGGVLINGKVQNNDAAYMEVLRIFGQRMHDLGLSMEESRELQQKIDQDLCKSLGFSDKNRFAESLVRTYESLSSKYNQPINDFMVEELYTLGQSVFKYRYMPLPGALSTLHALTQNYRIAVVTKGNYDEQLRKVRNSGVSKFVDTVYPVGFKNVADWSNVLQDLKIQESEYVHTWAIGNAPKSDINVPLSIGLNAIHVNQGGWKFEQEEYLTPKEDRQLIIVDTISEILNHLEWR